MKYVISQRDTFDYVIEEYTQNGKLLDYKLGQSPIECVFKMFSEEIKRHENDTFSRMVKQTPGMTIDTVRSLSDYARMLREFKKE